jgi:hypothetical protein
MIGAMFVAVSAHAQVVDLSFTINGRSVTLPLDTPILIDDELATLADLRLLPNGMQARWSELTLPLEGVGATPVFSFTLIGPVTSTDPLEVLGQPVTITGDTTLQGLFPTTVLPLNAPLVVAGLVDVNGSVLATLVERRGLIGNKFLLTGAVLESGAQAGSFRVGQQWVSAPGLTFVDCAGAVPLVGEYVELRATSVPDFPPGSVLDTVTGGRCVSLVPPGTAGAGGFLQGLITAVPQPDQFAIGALTVTHTAATQFTFGSVDAIAPGVAVIVDGAYLDASAFVAESVAFVRPFVRFEAPLAPADVSPGESIRPFGVEVLWTAQVRDEDGILANGLTHASQVEVRGYIDGEGQAYATRVRERGNPDPADVRLVGPVEVIADPLLQIQGLTVDTSGAIFEDEIGTPMTPVEFFAVVQVEEEVGVSAASYDSASSTLSGGIVSWSGVVGPIAAGRVAGAASLIRAGTASDYALPDAIHGDGFE